MVTGQTILSTLRITAIGAVLVLQWSVLVAPVLATETILSPLKITEIYPDAPGAAELHKEYIEVGNMGTSPLDLSVYQLQVKNHPTKKMRLGGELAPYQFQAFITPFTLLNAGDTLQLVRFSGAEELVLEEVAYAATPDDTWSWSYFPEGWERTVPTPNEPNYRAVEEPEPEPESPPIDSCLATPAIDSTIPEGYSLNEQGECTEDPPEQVADCQVVITEISAQANLSGKEYIEFFHPASSVVTLQRCNVHINGKPPRVLPAHTMQPGEYYVWELGSGTISNSGGTVVLQQGSGELVSYQYVETRMGQVINYDLNQPGGVVSSVPTPGEANKVEDQNSEGGEGSGEAPLLADCGYGRYRSPETNRCRNVEVAAGTLAACASNQERNPETNRCRKVSVATAALVPCKVGQERNPETNRCRQIAANSSSLKPCAEGQERNPETNRCRKATAMSDIGTSLGASHEQLPRTSLSYTTPIIISIAVACIGYGLYEYRFELQNVAHKVKWFPSRGRPPD